MITTINGWKKFKLNENIDYINVYNAENLQGSAYDLIGKKVEVNLEEAESIVVTKEIVDSITNELDEIGKDGTIENFLTGIANLDITQEEKIKLLNGEDFEASFGDVFEDDEDEDMDENSNPLTENTNTSPSEIIEAWVEKYLNANNLPKEKRLYNHDAGESIINNLTRKGFEIVKIKKTEEVSQTNEAKAPAIFTIECEKTGSMGRGTPSYSYQTGTLEELIKAYSYTLETGKSYEREKGNKKINTSPKNVKSLVDNLNNAVNNSAANGYAGKDYRILPEGQEKKK